MSIELTPQQESFVRNEAARSGMSADEVAQRAVDLYAAQLEHLRSDIQHARGQTSMSFDPDDFLAGMKEKCAHLTDDA